MNDFEFVMLETCHILLLIFLNTIFFIVTPKNCYLSIISY